MLLDRRSEREVLDRLLEAVRGGESRVLVLRGEPGVGKSALLEYVAGRASGCRVGRAAGVQSEMELAFAGLHQLCAPMLDRLERLPAPQRDALGTAFGLTSGGAPDRFLVGLALLGLLTEVADERPLVCLVDDAHWLDRASLQALEFVAVNDITDTKTLAHLLKYDSIHRRFPGTVEAQGDALVVNGKPIKVSAIKEPEKLPWKALGVDLVLESTGRFTDRPDADKHLAAGAKKVVISAPAKGEDITIVMGVNHQKYDPAKHHVLSNASCTTNCLVPVVKVVLDNWGFKHGFMTTIHSYTNDQQILDLPHKDLRRARAAALSIIPTTTGAAKATSLVIPEVKGKIDGISLRVPTPDVSVVELTAEVEKKTTIQEVNDAFKQAARSTLQGILDVSDEPLVSVDYIGSFYSSVVDALSTNVIDGTFLHVSSWYDNEMGYSARCVDLLAYLARK